MIKRNKKPSWYYMNHANDVYTDLGYDYRGHVFEKTMSNQLFKNSTTKAILGMIEVPILYLIDAVKSISAHYLISVDKNETRIN